MRQTMINRRRRGRCLQRGAVAVLFSLALPVVIGLAALAIDVSRLVVVRAELQSAADACALAAVSQLRSTTASTSQLLRAEAHGLALSDALAQSISGDARPADSLNRFDFQSRQLNGSMLAVRFSSSASGPWRAASVSSGSISHVQCSADGGQIPLYLAGVVGVRQVFPVTARAVAALAPSQVNCAFPMALCKAPGTRANSSKPFGLQVGDWMREPSSQGTNRYDGAGNFGWVDFDPPSGGAEQLQELIAGRGSCSLELGRKVGESGAKSSVYDAWNSRFGLYGSGGPTPAASPGDLSGYAYTSKTWPDGRNAYSGTAKGAAAGTPNFLASRAGFAPYQGNSASGVNAKYSTNWSSADRRAQGRERRLVVVPIVDCAVWDSSGSVQPVIEGWGCALLLSPIATSGSSGPGQAEFLGLASDLGSPCASNGLPGSSLSAGPLVPVLVE